jgi:hypothetical protein
MSAVPSPAAINSSFAIKYPVISDPVLLMRSTGGGSFLGGVVTMAKSCVKSEVICRFIRTFLEMFILEHSGIDTDALRNMVQQLLSGTQPHSWAPYIDLILWQAGVLSGATLLGYGIGSHTNPFAFNGHILPGREELSRHYLELFAQLQRSISDVKSSEEKSEDASRLVTFPPWIVGRKATPSLFNVKLLKDLDADPLPYVRDILAYGKSIVGNPQADPWAISTIVRTLLEYHAVFATGKTCTELQQELLDLFTAPGEVRFAVHVALRLFNYGQMTLQELEEYVQGLDSEFANAVISKTELKPPSINQKMSDNLHSLAGFYRRESKKLVRIVAPELSKSSGSSENASQVRHSRNAFPNPLQTQLQLSSVPEENNLADEQEKSKLDQTIPAGSSPLPSGSSSGSAFALDERGPLSPQRRQQQSWRQPRSPANANQGSTEMGSHIESVSASNDRIEVQASASPVNGDSNPNLSDQMGSSDAKHQDTRIYIAPEKIKEAIQRYILQLEKHVSAIFSELTEEQQCAVARHVERWAIREPLGLDGKEPDLNRRVVSTMRRFYPSAADEHLQQKKKNRTSPSSSSSSSKRMRERRE